LSKTVIAVGLFVAGFIASVASFGQASQPALFDSGDVKSILSHGPWPLPKAGDAGNEFSGNRFAIELGKKLFFDPRLSVNKSVSCATCHDPKKAFADGLPVSKSLDPNNLLTRNSPSLFNAAHERWYGWDGASDSQWAQSLRPLLDAREMGLSMDKLKATVSEEKDIYRTYKTVFSEPSLNSSEVVSVNIAKALGAYVATLYSGKSTFDRFRDNLARGDLAKAATYPSDAQRGLKIFVGKGQCGTCHAGPMFSNGEFGDTGIPFFIRPGVVDSGRHGGIEELRRSPYNLLGTFSRADELTKQKTLYVDLQHRNFGEFKVPSLRNAAKTAPYMHNGSLATLEAVVNHYSELNVDRLHADGDQILKPLKLSDQEKRDLVAFLKSL
jgi:cytochrome c peroxidase